MKGGVNMPEPIVINGERIYRPVEARAYLGISEITMNRWRTEGWLEGYEVGRGYQYTRKQLDAALKAKGYK